MLGSRAMPPLILLFLLGLAGADDNGMLPEQPNVLFLMCDSMDGRVLDPTSPVSRRLEMPHLRALASTGVNFLNTYAASPQCVPSRAAMFTGRRTDQTQAWNNEQGIAVVPRTGELDQVCLQLFDEETCSYFREQQNVSATIVDTLRDLGMEPSLYGKVDVGAGIMQDKLEANATCNGFHSGPSLSILTRTADIRKATKPDPLAITNDKDNHVHEEDWKMLPKCIDFLRNKAEQRRLGAKEGLRNWMLYCSINIPHPAFDTNATWLSMVHEDKIPAPKWLPEEIFHPADSYMSQSKSVWREFNASEVHKVRKTYYAMCAETDYMLGSVIEALKNFGLYNNTFIIFLSDHGEMNMEHRQVWKNSMYEASSRVPLIISPPPNMPAMRRGQTVTNLTSLLDIYPTLVEMAQLTKSVDKVVMPSFLSGHSLFPFLYEKNRHRKVASSKPPYPKDRKIVSQYHSNMGNTGSFMLRKGNYKYIAFGRTAYDPSYTPQLFDVVEDPEELRDLSLDKPEVARALDLELRDIIGDYYAIDAKARRNDYKVYKRFFAEKYDRTKLRELLSAAYTGFDDGDMAKVDAWVKNETLAQLLGHV